MDLLFPAALLAIVATDLWRARHGRGLPLVAVLGVFLLANLLTHMAALEEGWQFGGIGRRLGLAALVLLISLIGGRVIPNFTGNWLQARGEPRPLLFGPADSTALIGTAAAMLVWAIQPDGTLSGVLLGLAAALQAIRFARWRGHRTLAEPLVWSLHLAYLWVPLGLGLLALAVFAPERVPPSAGMHALASGAIAGMILAMTTRATLGHTGRDLHADRWTLAIYLFICIGAAVRVASTLIPTVYLTLLGAAGMFWLLAFGLFVLRYGPMLVAARVDGRAP